MRAHIKLIIFDCDGVLLDSQKSINKFEWVYLRFLGLPISLEQYNERFSGERILSILERIEKENNFCFQKPLLLLAKEIEEALLLYLSDRRIVPILGIEPLLQELTLKKCVASNCFSDLLLLLLTSSGLLSYFHPNIFSYEEVGIPKPAPDLFLYAAHRMGEDPKNCLVIEDSVVGVRAAKAAGMNVYGFVGGSHTTHLSAYQLLDAGASCIFKNMKELSYLLKENLSGINFQLSINDNKDSLNHEKESELRTISQLEEKGIYDQRVLQAMRTIPRYLFVQDSLKKQSYRDVILPIGYGETISPPYIVAMMCEAAQLSPKDKVLEIGTGTGYQSAILSLLAKEVYTIEIVHSLTVQAQNRLKSLGYTNVHVKEGDGYFGWSENAPYDFIFVTAAISEIPPPLLDQLKDKGSLIMPLIEGEEQLLVRVQKTKEGLIQESIAPVVFSPLKHSSAS